MGGRRASRPPSKYEAGAGSGQGRREGRRDAPDRELKRAKLDEGAEKMQDAGAEEMVPISSVLGKLLRVVMELQAGKQKLRERATQLEGDPHGGVELEALRLQDGASAAQVRSQPLDVPARRVVPRCAACDALTAPPAMNRVPFWLGETFSDSIARMPSNTHARIMIECSMKQCTAVCSATWDQGGSDRFSTPRNFMSPATTATKVSWHFAALVMACSIISIQRRVSASSQPVPNPVDHVKSLSSACCC